MCSSSTFTSTYVTNPERWRLFPDRQKNSILPMPPQSFCLFESIRAADGRSAAMFVMKSATRLRVARPTDHLADVLRFYRDGVGLTEIGSFQDHEGFDGVMLGVPGASYHLEFTRQHDHTAGRGPTQENLLVFYLPSRQEWQA